MQPGVIWTGSNNGFLYLTRDAGKQWLDVTPPDISMYSVIDVHASRFNPAEAYAAVRNDAIGDYTPHIYRTRDFGRSWQEVVTGLPTDEATASFVRALKESDHKRGLLFAATESSIHVSFDELADREIVLFRPRAAIRVQANINQDTPFPPEVPHGKNPPQGLVIDYHLKRSAQHVQLQIFDGQGALVRTYSNTPAGPHDQPLPPAAAFWARPSLPLPDSAGQHRVTWDMRYPTPDAIFFDQSSGAVPEDTAFIPEGPMALPGNYEVKLTVDAVSHTQPVLLKQDPRLDHSQAAMEGMRRQLALSRQITGLLSKTKAAYEHANAVAARLSSLRSDESSEETKKLRAQIADLAGTVDDAAVGLSGGSYAVPPVKGTTSFSRINVQASTLLGMVEFTTDQPPVSSLYRTYSDLCADLDATLKAWQSLQEKAQIVLRGKPY